jgi:hypothetical protein
MGVFDWLRKAIDKVKNFGKAVWGKFLKPTLKAIAPYGKAIGAAIGAGIGGPSGATIGAQVGGIAGTIASDLANGRASSAVENAKAGVGLVQPKPSQTWLSKA